MRTRRAVMLTAKTFPGLAFLALLSVIFLLFAALASSAKSAPPATSPYVVSVGDSYISGEAGRWAGNLSESVISWASWKAGIESVISWAGKAMTPFLIDALGSSAYHDNAAGKAESITGCHRSKSAGIHIGSAYAGSRNFACSGAITTTVKKNSKGKFKPGLDFYTGPEGVGQLVSLREFAKTHNVKMVSVSIGGNDFKFGPIVENCLKQFLLTSQAQKGYCSEDKAVYKNFTAAKVAERTEAIRQSYLRIGEAMASAGYSANDYKIVAQDYPEMLPDSSRIRYPQTIRRQSAGGCGLWNRDIDWALNKALPAISKAIDDAAAGSGLANIRRLNLTNQYRGHRLCERGTELVDKFPGHWADLDAVDNAEWVSQIRTLTTVLETYAIQEGFHPNYWGQLALRSCLRQAFTYFAAADAARVTQCIPNGDGLSARGEPRMNLAR